MNNPITDEKLKEAVYSMLSESKIPVEEIITSNVRFTNKITQFNSVYIYYSKRKYNLKIVTYRKAEEETHNFTELNDLVYHLASLQMRRKAVHECGNQYKNYYFDLLKQIDERFYSRAIEDWNRTHL